MTMLLRNQFGLVLFPPDGWLLYTKNLKHIKKISFRRVDHNIDDKTTTTTGL